MANYKMRPELNGEELTRAVTELQNYMWQGRMDYFYRLEGVLREHGYSVQAQLETGELVIIDMRQLHHVDENEDPRAVPEKRPTREMQQEARRRLQEFNSPRGWSSMRLPGKQERDDEAWNAIKVGWINVDTSEWLTVGMTKQSPPSLPPPPPPPPEVHLPDEKALLEAFHTSFNDNATEENEHESEESRADAESAGSRHVFGQR